ARGATALWGAPPPPLAPAPPPPPPGRAGYTPGGAQGYALPGADAEANSNVLRGRSAGRDPLVTLAEQAVRASTDDETDVPQTAAPQAEAPQAEAPLADVPTPVAPITDADPAADTDVPETAVPEAPAPEADAPPASAEEPAPAPAQAQVPAQARPGMPAESPAETTMELFIPAPAAEPEPAPAPERPAPAAPAVPAAPAAGPVADPYAIGPDSHQRTPDETEEPVTSKGLPKRTPKITAPVSGPRQRSGSVDAEALRRRLGGFRRGAEAGHREVAAEIAEQTGRNELPTAAAAQSAEPAVPARPAAPAAPATPATPARNAVGDEATGGTVEEARS
ncbi:hypothetical protein ACFXGE_34450, partial [Streptomyces sp. NPDC059378]